MTDEPRVTVGVVPPEKSAMLPSTQGTAGRGELILGVSQSEWINSSQMPDPPPVAGETPVGSQ